jgi:hypothetical protein
MSVTGLCYPHRWDLLHLLRRFPRSFLVEVVFLLVGIIVGPDPPIGGNHLPLNIASHPENPTPVKPHDRAITYIRLTPRSLLQLRLGYAVLREGAGDGDTRTCACSLGRGPVMYNASRVTYVVLYCSVLWRF